ncbi:MAG: DUF2924 domain-containing protein [Polyangiaceae bacterium]
MNLETMNLTALRSEYNRVFGLETTSKSKDYLRQRISTRRAELARERAARHEGTRERDPRLPPVGTVLERDHEGKTHRVKVTDVGFEYRRQTYPSLSAVAKAITGTNWNGFGFFGLLQGASAEQSAS